MRYIAELDGLRAIAVTLVILFHAAGPVTGGFIGVDIFFVLSAFLITGILLDEHDRLGAYSISRFYWRRAVRLTPALALFLVAYLIVAPSIWPLHDHGRDAVLTALYLSDYSYSFWGLPLYLQHTWSLAVEEHFYLLWPLLLAPLMRAKHPILLLGAAWIAFTGWRFAVAGDWTSYYYRFDTRATGLILGAILCLALRDGRIAFRPIHGWIAAGLLALLTFTANIGRAIEATTIAELAAAAMIGCVATGKAGAFHAILASRPLVVVGKLSYAMYLWHFPFAYLVRGYWGFAATALASFLFALVAAAISYASVEAIGRRASRRAVAV